MYESGEGGLDPRSTAAELLQSVRSVGLETGADLALSLLFAAFRDRDELARAIRQFRGPELLHRIARSNGWLPDGFLERAADDGGLALERAARAVLTIANAHGGSSEQNLSATFEAVLDARGAMLGKGQGAWATPRSLAQLMAQLTVRTGDIVLDPACGVGNALKAAADLGAAQLIGVDMNETVASLAAMRFEINQIPAEVHLRNTLARPGTERADVLLLEPPWGLRDPEMLSSLHDIDLHDRWNSPEFAWIGRSLELLNDGGRAAILLPAIATTRSRDQEARRYLVKRGLLEAIFEFPPGIIPSSGVAASLWLLRQQADARPHFPVLLVDVSAMVDASRRPVELTQAAIAALAAAVEEHRAGMPTSLPHHVALPVPPEFLEHRTFTLKPSLFLPEQPVQSARPRPQHRLLTRIGVGGFKSFDLEQLAEIRPVTLVFGANSSGKSSLMQSLLLLKQSMGFTNIVMQGPVTDAGSFVGALHGHDTEREVAFSVGFGSDETWTIPESGVPDPSLERLVRFRFGADPSGLPQLREIVFSCGTWALPVQSMELLETSESQLYIRTEDLESAMEAWDADIPIYPPNVAGPSTYTPSPRNVGRHESAQRHLLKYGVHEIGLIRDGLLPSASRPELPPDAYTSERARSTARSYIGRGVDLIAGISAEVRELLADLTYLGPLRSAPQRFYDRTAVSAEPNSGGHVALYLFDHESETRQVNDWLQRLGIPYTVRVAPLASTGLGHITGDLVTMVLTDLRSGIDVSPSDVGFGVSQVLPVVVEALARSNSVICIEQPEIHLHPALQTSLGDLLIESSAPTGRANQLIVETHSEHLVLRLQRRVREGVIEADDVAILYVDQDADGAAVVTRLRLDSNGDFIDEWPHGFFDERLDELFGGAS